MLTFDVYRTRIENYDGEEFLNHFDTICNDLYTKLGVLTFAFILYDEGTPELRKLLRDSDYWDALDAASGDHMVVFTLSDERKSETEVTELLEAMTVFRGTSQRPSKSYSKVMKTLFDSESLLVFPSVLFFHVIDSNIRDYRLVPLRRQTIHESVKAIQDLFQAMTAVLDAVEPQFYGNQREIFQLVKSELQNRDFTMYILKGPGKLLDFVGKIKKLAGL